eukprot:TRINITY_DN20958_c0_g1_i1.p2 TRINITY_DN20958_c0_g1~~TRINITY_DN20958_c0_g1_i1.p2  ORF type:complete len:258 (+),score=41.51 TRINITY_DN20958_c0_g1_i1:306-1079(+)
MASRLYPKEDPAPASATPPVPLAAPVSALDASSSAAALPPTHGVLPAPAVGLADIAEPYTPAPSATSSASSSPASATLAVGSAPMPALKSSSASSSACVPDAPATASKVGAATAPTHAKSKALPAHAAAKPPSKSSGSLPAAPPAVPKADSAKAAKVLIVHTALVSKPVIASKLKEVFVAELKAGALDKEFPRWYADNVWASKKAHDDGFRKWLQSLLIQLRDSSTGFRMAFLSQCKDKMEAGSTAPILPKFPKEFH